MAEKQQEWTDTIESSHSLFKLNLKEVWDYKDLVYMFVKRDFVSSFKQTILGPVWFFINPIFTTLMYVLVFGKIANISTDGAPQVLFYLAGVTLWNYFFYLPHGNLKCIYQQCEYFWESLFSAASDAAFYRIV